MTVSSVQLPLYFRDTHSPVTGPGKGSEPAAQGSEARTGAAASEPASAGKIQAALSVVRGIDTGALLPALQDLQAEGTAVASSRSAYADAIALIGADAPVPVAAYHSEADYALNP